MIYSAFVFIDPGRWRFAQRFAIHASPWIPNGFVEIPLRFLAGGVGIVKIGLGPSFRVGFYKVYTVPSGHRKSTAISTVFAISLSKFMAFMGSISRPG